MNVTLELVSSFKRKDVKGIMALIAAEHNEDLAKEINEAGRLTNALIDRTIGVLVDIDEPVEVEEFEEPLPEFAEASIQDKAKEEAEEFVNQLADLTKLIEAGEKKKAKKLYKAIKESGIRGSEIKKFKDQIKAL